jgi:hypothetical protein
MRLYRVFADKKLFGNLAVAHANGNQLEYLGFATSNTQFTQFSFISMRMCFFT